MLRLSALILLGCALGVGAKDKSLIRNGSFENLDESGFPRHWTSAQHGGVPAYEFKGDSKRVHHGEHSLRVRRTQPQVWGIAEQIIDGEKFIGKTLVFTLSLRSEGVGKKGASVYATAFIDGMLLERSKSEKIRGDSDWNTYELRLTVPEETNFIRVGVSLDDAGTIWIDDAKLVVAKHD
jgi:hypothetical protein